MLGAIGVIELALRKSKGSLLPGFAPLLYALFFAVSALKAASYDPSEKRIADKLSAKLPPDISKSRPAFISPNFKSLQLRLFQKGDYWRILDTSLGAEAFFREAESMGVRAFVLGPEQRKDPRIRPLFRGKDPALSTPAFDHYLSN